MLQISKKVMSRLKTNDQYVFEMFYNDKFSFNSLENLNIFADDLTFERHNFLGFKKTKFGANRKVKNKTKTRN